jgi:hypothetical protein
MVGGRLVPIRIGLVLGGALLVVLALIESLWVAIVAVVVALVALRAYCGPALAMLSEACDDADIGQVWGLALALVTATTRFIVGSSASGAVADLAGAGAGAGWAYCGAAAVPLAAAVLAFQMRDAACRSRPVV